MSFRQPTSGLAATPTAGHRAAFGQCKGKPGSSTGGATTPVRRRHRQQRLGLLAVRLRPALSLAACLFGVASNAQQASPAAEELLGEVVATYRVGDLKGAWDAFASFLEHPSRNELDIVAFANCFNKRRCPQVGALGRILGIPRAELAKRIEGFCPRLRSPDVEAALVESGVSESDLAEYRKTYPRIVRKVFMAHARPGGRSSWN